MPRRNPQAERVAAVLSQVVEQAAGLPPTAMNQFMPVLREARDELKRDLWKWLNDVPDGRTRFTAQRYRQALLQLETAISQLRNQVPTGLLDALRATDAVSADLAVAGLARQTAAFALEFGQSVRPLPIDRAALMVDSNKARGKRYKHLAARYGTDMAQDIRRTLAVGLVKGETFSEMTERLVKHGGPRGLVSLRKSGVHPSDYAEGIADGLFRRYRHWAERIVRTETLATFNEQEMQGLRLLEDNDPGWVKRWDATFDRGCAICRSLDGQVREIEKEFSGGLLQPPAHPNCRCGVTAWRREWMSDAVNLVGAAAPPN